MSTMTLQMPMNYVEIERDEMEYVDGGAQKVNYWWGWAVNLDPKECGIVATCLNYNIGGEQLVGSIAAAIPGIGLPGALACAMAAQNAASAKTTLELCEKAGKHATLTKNLLGYFITVW